MMRKALLRVERGNQPQWGNSSPGSVGLSHEVAVLTQIGRSRLDPDPSRRPHIPPHLTRRTWHTTLAISKLYLRLIHNHDNTSFRPVHCERLFGIPVSPRHDVPGMPTHALAARTYVGNTRKASSFCLDSRLLTPSNGEAPYRPI